MHLEELGFDLFELVLEYLSLKEKSAVACTCKTFNELLQEHWYHQCQKLDHKHVVEEFLEKQYVFQHEKNIAFKMIEFSCRQRYINTYTLGYTHRQLVANVDYFPHRGNINRIPVIYCNDLNRNIVVLEAVCWLHFDHTFIKVFPGLYYALFCIKLENVNWPSLGPDNTTLSIESDGVYIVQSKILATQWGEMENREKRQHIKLQSCNIVEAAVSNRWFFLQMGPLIIKKSCNVKFQFEELNSWWKTGIYWDYIELRPIVIS